MRVALRFPHPLARGLPRMVSYSIAGHLLLGVAILTVPGLMPRASTPSWDQPIDAFVVDSLPARASAPPAAAAAPEPAAPEPAPPKARPAPEPEPPPPPPEKPKKKPPEKKVEKPAQKPEPPAPQPQAPTAAAEPASGSANEPQAAASTGGAGDVGATADEGIGVSYGGVSFGYSYYNSQMVNKLRANWQRPVFPADAPVEIGVRVRFRIDRRGQVSEASVETPSNYPALDTSALRAVHAAAPFPPLPPQFTEETLLVAVTFTLQPTGL